MKSPSRARNTVSPFLGGAMKPNPRFRFTSNEELIKKFERSKLDLYWLEWQIENSTGQPHCEYTRTWEKEDKDHTEMQEELRLRGLVQ